MMTKLLRYIWNLRDLDNERDEWHYFSVANFLITIEYTVVVNLSHDSNDGSLYTVFSILINSLQKMPLFTNTHRSWSNIRKNSLILGIVHANVVSKIFQKINLFLTEENNTLVNHITPCEKHEAYAQMLILTYTLEYTIGVRG